ncbi:hypothetical protein SCUP515_00551 [Seiridium cupressi]
MDVYSVPPQPPVWDEVSKFYVAFCATWTTLLFAGVAFLISNRRNPILKIRGLPLSLTAILFLHAYWILGQIVYPIGRSLPVILAYDIQYFFMGIWFPLGIALFHASNARFLYIAELQKQFTRSRYRKQRHCNGASISWLCRLGNMDYTKRILVYIGFGMIFQVLLTVGMWFACKKYHPTFGIPGTELHGNLMQQLIELGRGWEWWPSVAWQVVWTWIVAPILIWRAWGIRDTHGWRLQTIGCCASNLISLHATPMFLVASYVPAFAPVNVYFAPSEWIHLSIMFFEIFTIFIPCYLVVRQKIESRKAADNNARWKTSSQTTIAPSNSDEWKSMPQLEKAYSTENLKEDTDDSLLTLTALNRVLEDDPGPLQEFSALRDFSGENIAFLTRVSKWKSSWVDFPTEDEMRDAFTQALGIYTDLISPRDAEFPINLASQDMRDLEAIFERPARIICGDARVDPAVPFAAGGLTTPHRSSNDTSSATSAHSRIEFGEFTDRVRYMGEISDSFGPKVFDSAHKNIKYLVLTNTWTKFIHETQQRQSLENERSDFINPSEMTLVSRMTQAVRSFL